MAKDADLETLADVVTRLRRALRRGVRPAVPHEALAPAQVEVLQYLAESPGLRAGELTDRMLLAPTTISTLIGQLLDRGLVERRPHPTDRRAWQLHATAAGLAELTHWQAATLGALRPAMQSLTKADRQAVRAALPALERLVAALDVTTPESAEADPGAA
jgi:DNA-binding MarR family transcriptional regulator